MHQLASVDNTIRFKTRSLLASSEVLKTSGMERAQEVLDARRCGASATLIASLLSHDIRHHLSVVYCNAEFLSETATLDADRKELFEEVKMAITDATRMLDFILFHAKNDLPAQDAVESINDRIQRTVSTVRPHPHAEGVSITIGESSQVCALFNYTLIGSAIYNLLLNACHAAQRSGRPGQVEISLHEDREFIFVRVQDNGGGVPDAVKEEITRPFLAPAKWKGNGLGITIADSVAHEYGGTLELEASSPGGTIFALRLARTALRATERVPCPAPQARSLQQIARDTFCPEPIDSRLRSHALVAG